jgi:hypothetical protein
MLLFLKIVTCCLYPQHAILKPFMLRRVKIDVIAEMTKKKEEIVQLKVQITYHNLKKQQHCTELCPNENKMQKYRTTCFLT